MSEIKDLAPLEPDLPERRLVRRYPVVPLQPDNSEISSYLRTYWHILLKRKWTILTITLVIATLATIFAFKTKPIYQAISRVSVQGETPQFQTVQNLDEPQDPDDTYLETQVTVLKSDDLAWKTIEQLHLDQSPEFKVSASQAASNQGDPEAEEASLIQKFNRALNVHLLDGTRVIEVAFESPDASLAARVVNALVNNYIEYNFRTKYDATEQASAWMEQRLDDLKAKVEKSQEALVQYERENSIIDIGNRQNVMEQRLGSLSQDLTDAQNDLAQKQSLYQLAEANPDQVGVLVQDTLLETLQGKLGDLKTQYVNELSQYGPKFPKVLRLHDQIEEVGSLMKQEEKQTLARVQHNYLASLGREKILAAAVDQEKAAIGKASQLLVEDNILKHEFQTNESLYDGLLMHVKNATVSAGLRANNVNILDHALVPTSPVRPKKARDVAVGLVIGLMLGITVAFVQEGFDNSVRNAEDIERFTQAPALAIIPSAESVRPRRAWLGGSRQSSHLSNGDVALAVAKMPSSPIAESFRTLRTSVLLSTAPRPPQTILVTSSQPGEGKTSTSLNLALSLAQRGGQVLIVDGDLRKASIGHALSLTERKGLSGVLTGAHKLEETLIRIESLSNLWVLAAGPHPPNPAELLSSPTMEQLLKDLRQQFDFIVLDSPPLLAFTDAIVLSTLVDGIVLVAESGVTPRSALTRSYRMLQDAGGKVLGTVVNKMDIRTDGYYGYTYRRYYHSYYHKEASGAISSRTTLINVASLPANGPSESTADVANPSSNGSDEMATDGASPSPKTSGKSSAEAASPLANGSGESTATDTNTSGHDPETGKAREDDSRPAEPASPIQQSTPKSFLKDLGGAWGKTTIFLLAIGIPGLWLGYRTGVTAVAATMGRSADPAELLKAVTLDPSNPDLHYRLGVAYCYSLDDPQPDKGLSELRRATELDPMQPVYWSALASACESLGDAACADHATERTLRLAPMIPRYRWDAANRDLADGNSAAALAQFRKLLELDPGYAPESFRLSLRLDEDPLSVYQKLLAGQKDPRLDFAYVDYLSAHGQGQQAYPVWQASIDHHPHVPFTQADPYLEWLLQQGEDQMAVNAWQELEQHGIISKSSADAPGNLVFNSGFEQPLLNAGFGWRVQPEPYTRVRLDEAGNYQGRSSLRVDFTVSRNGDDEPVYEIIPVQPNHAYALQAYARSANITSDSGPRLRVVDPVCPSCLDASTQGTVGTTNWHRVSANFSTGPTTRLVRVSVWRPRGLNFPSAISGTFWLDAVSLEDVTPANQEAAQK